MEDMNQLYSDIILEHNQDQANKHELDPHNLQEHGHNPSCGDDITLQADIQGGIIKDAAYTGHGCAISQASTDIMIDLIRGKSVKEALRLVDLFLAMIKREETDDGKLEELDDAIALKNISNMPARVKCAVLAWHTLKDALEKEENKSATASQHWLRVAGRESQARRQSTEFSYACRNDLIHAS